ncbi:MAG: TIGR02266 family protein [Archangium sp.]|nr:TIGR02266 family protein [Archangium sp.]MBM4778123.1 TIGR02266 family protein [Archangiaceae bacterium]
MSDKTPKPTPSPSTTRKAERLQHELLVAYRTVGSFITDFAVNISRGGIFINTREPASVGTIVRLIISLPDAAFPFDLTGRVIRVQPYDPQSDQMSGMGIEFMDVDDEKRARLERFVDRLRAELPEDKPVKK